MGFLIEWIRRAIEARLRVATGYITELGEASFSGFIKFVLFLPLAGHRGSTDSTLANEDEFLEWLGVRSMDVVDYSLVRRRMAGLCRHLVITRGERGAKIVAAVGDGPPVHVPAVAKGARDVTGAGDTVLAAMAAWWDNTTLTEAVTIGMHAAACAVMHVGTQVVDRASIERMLTFSRSEANHAS